VIHLCVSILIVEQLRNFIRMTITVKEGIKYRKENQAKAAGHSAVPKAGHSFTSYAELFNSTNGSPEPQQSVKKTA
jgi:hypothetical protein